MTREKAIRLLSGLMFKGKLKEALDMAIKALKQEPTTKNDLEVDCISRKTVIEGLKRYFHNEYYQRTSIQDCRDCFIEDVLNRLPSVTPQEPRWVLVSERMPEYGKAVLTYHEDDEEYQINWVTDDETGEWFYENPTAWMPLPEPYEPQESEK